MEDLLDICVFFGIYIVIIIGFSLGHKHKVERAILEYSAKQIVRSQKVYIKGFRPYNKQAVNTIVNPYNIYSFSRADFYLGLDSILVVGFVGFGFFTMRTRPILFKYSQKGHKEGEVYISGIRKLPTGIEITFFDDHQPKPPAKFFGDTYMQKKYEKRASKEINLIARKLPKSICDQIITNFERLNENSMS